MRLTREYLDTKDMFEDFRHHIDVFIDDELPLESNPTTVVEYDSGGSRNSSER